MIPKLYWRVLSVDEAENSNAYYFCNMLFRLRTFHLYPGIQIILIDIFPFLDNEFNGYMTAFGGSIHSKVEFNGISSSKCLQLAGSDGKGNLYQTQSVSCQTAAPTICRKNIGNYQLPL
jgi:hypothetical protein